MKLTLIDYIDSRCKELGITKQYMLDTADLDWSVLSNIKKGKNIRQETKQKLAIGLQCTIGDINAALANTPHPLRKEAAKPEGVHPVDKKMPAKKSVTEPEPEPDEMPPEVFQPDREPEPDVDIMFPVETPEEPEETLKEFKARMRTVCLRKFVEQNNGEKAKILIAEYLLNELLA